MAYKEDIGLTGAYGSAKAPMNLFIQAYDCVIKGGGKSGGNTTQTNNQSAQSQGNNQSSQGQETTQSGNEQTQGGKEQQNSKRKLMPLDQSIRKSFFTGK
jgi:hypothetical protein